MRVRADHISISSRDEMDHRRAGLPRGCAIEAYPLKNALSRVAMRGDLVGGDLPEIFVAGIQAFLPFSCRSINVTWVLPTTRSHVKAQALHSPRLKKT